MSPQDPRHGKVAGYSAGCREACCRRAHTAYRARERAEKRAGLRRMVDATGTHRRIRALQRVGYSELDLANHLGRSAKYVGHLLDFPRVRVTTAQAVAGIYDDLCMTWPSGWVAKRNRTTAANHGWPSPLAWDDDTIDDPAAEPALDADVEDFVDEIAVHRRMHGDKTVPLTPAEQDELVRRALAAHWTWDRIEDMCGVNVHRSLERLREVA